MRLAEDFPRFDSALGLPMAQRQSPKTKEAVWEAGGSVLPLECLPALLKYSAFKLRVRCACAAKCAARTVAMERPGAVPVPST